ncbi:hypothetical protein CR513_23541, partial [Mucuna pruriens]
MILLRLNHLVQPITSIIKLEAINNLSYQDYTFIIREDNNTKNYNLGICSILDAGLWGILHGLELAWRMGFWNIIIYFDSQVVVNLLANCYCHLHPCYSLIKLIYNIH